MDVSQQANNIETRRVLVELGIRTNKDVIKCPWHTENTASFHIYKGNKGAFCFGCNRGGNNISIVMISLNCTKIQAIDWFKEKFPNEVKSNQVMLIRGATALKPIVPTPIKKQEEKIYKITPERIAEINKMALKLFRYSLKENKQAMQYLINRSISAKVAKDYYIGFAPRSYAEKLYVRGVSKEELYESGMLLQTKEGKDYEPLSNRVIFPIIDNKIMGFGGRAIFDWQKVKYINTNDNSLYHKKDILYGMNIARNSDLNYVILVEGYIDVLSIYKTGIDSVVASCGTAFTIEHARLIVSLGKRIYVMYDNDTAGLKASKLAIDLIGKDLCTKVTIPDGKDPDGFVCGGGDVRDLLNSIKN